MDYNIVSNKSWTEAPDPKGRIALADFLVEKILFCPQFRNASHHLKSGFSFANSLEDSFSTSLVDDEVRDEVMALDGVHVGVLDAVLSTLVMWSASKQVYTTEYALSDSLIKSNINNIPFELLSRLPHSCFYLDFPVGIDTDEFFFLALGCFVSVLRHTDGVPYLSIVWLCRWAKDESKGGGMEHGAIFYTTEDHSYTLEYAPIIPIKGQNQTSLANAMMKEHASEWAIQQKEPSSGTDKEYEATRRTNGSGSDILGILTLTSSHIIPLLLYMCSEEPDLSVIERGRSSSKKYDKKKGGVVPPAASPNVVAIGANIGKKMEAATQAALDAEQQGTKAPHIRKAHWHTFWTGKGRTVPRAKFLPPILVGAEDIDVSAEK